MPNDLKPVIKALMPHGSAWRVVPDGDWDKYLSGSGENWGVIQEFFDDIGNMREPQLTAWLADLEKEFGIVTNTTITTAQRRNQLEAVAYAVAGTGSLDQLQQLLIDYGFSCIVQANDPPVDPDLFINDADLLVNGPQVLSQGLAYTTQCGGAFSVCGNTGAVCGAFSGIAYVTKDYYIPDDIDRWGGIFFIAGGATGWDDLIDGNMEQVGTLFWTAGPRTIASKVTSPHRSWFQSIKVLGDNNCGLPSYVEQLGSWGVTPRTVTGYAWGDGLAGVPLVYVRDPVSSIWSLIWVGSSSPVRQYFSVAVPGGVSGVRLCMVGSANGYTNFDDVSIFTPALTACNVPLARRYEFEKLILKFKPTTSWAGLKVNYV